MLRVTLSLLLAVTATMASEAQLPRSVTESLKIQAALRSGGLHEAARVAGGFYRMPWNTMPDLYVWDLVPVVGSSDAVVVGVPTSSKYHLSKDGSYITTDFRVVAEQVLMGDIPRGSEIVVSIVGGRIQFADGLAAEVEVVDMVPPKLGSRVAMMLEKNTWSSDELVAWTNGAPLYAPHYGPMSMYTLGSTDSIRIQLHSDAEQPVLRAHRRDSTGKFLQSLQAAIAKANRQRLAGRRH
jgi:hypothetical protein